MNGTRVMLQGAMDGGFRPSKEAREIEAELERIEREMRTWQKDGLRAAVILLGWFKAQGGE